MYNYGNLIDLDLGRLSLFGLSRVVACALIPEPTGPATVDTYAGDYVVLRDESVATPWRQHALIQALPGGLHPPSVAGCSYVITSL